MGVGAYLSLIGRGREWWWGLIRDWALIRGWALIRINTVYKQIRASVSSIEVTSDFPSP